MKQKQKPKSKYKTISIPTEMYNHIAKLIEEHQYYGYDSVSQFIKEGIRVKVEHIMEIERDTNPLVIKRKEPQTQ
jgi:hypothetical protein